MLPAGYTLRAAHLDDAPAVADLINACELLDLGAPNTSAHALRRIWRSPDHAPDDSLLVVAPDGRLVAALNRFPEGAHLVEFDGYTLPETRGLGIGSALLDLVETEARASQRDDTAAHCAPGDDCVERERRRAGAAGAAGLHPGAALGAHADRDGRSA